MENFPTIEIKQVLGTHQEVCEGSDMVGLGNEVDDASPQRGPSLVIPGMLDVVPQGIGHGLHCVSKNMPFGNALTLCTARSGCSALAQSVPLLFFCSARSAEGLILRFLDCFFQMM